MKKVVDIYSKMIYIVPIKTSCMGNKKNPRGKVSSPLSECLADKPAKKSKNKKVKQTVKEYKMESIKQITIGIVGGIFSTVAIFYGIDLEVARTDYTKNVELCKPIDNCLFDSNCERYNDLIEEACND